MEAIEDTAVKCDHPGCGVENLDLTHTRTVWPSDGHMKVEYYCAEHAPPDAEENNDDED